MNEIYVGIDISKENVNIRVFFTFNMGKFRMARERLYVTLCGDRGQR